MHSDRITASPGTRRPCRALARKEWRESRWKVVLGTLLCGVTGAILGPTYDWLGGLLGPAGMQTLPGSLGEALQAQLASYSLYIWSNWYGKNLFQYMLVLTIIFGAGLLAGEVSRRTSGFLFSKPVSRLHIMLVKYVVVLAVLWAGAAAGTAAALAGTFAAGHEVPVGWFLAGLPATLAGTAFLLALTTFASVQASEPLRAGGFMAVVAAFLFLLPVVLRPISTDLAQQLHFFWRMAAGHTFAHGAVEWDFVFACIALSALVLLAAHRRLQTREL